MSDSASALPGDSGATGGIARSTLVVMAGLGAALILGIIRQVVISNLFGTNAEYDAFTAANTIPELLYTMLSGGALAFAFIPVYAGLLTNSSTDGDCLFSDVFNVIFLVTGLASLIAAIFAPFLVGVSWGVAPSFSPEIQALTVQVMRLLLISTVIFAVSSILTGALHAHNHFLFPALAPSVYTLGIILGAFVLVPTLGVFGLAWGAVLGSVFHFLVQVPGMIRYQVRWSPVISLADSHFRRVAMLMAPRVIDLLMARVSIEWLNNNLASGMGEGRVAALRYSYTLMNMPWTLIGTAIATAVFPTMAVLAARSDVASQRRALSGSLRAVLTLAIPAAVGLVVLGRPIIQVLYQRGEFTAQSTELVYYALRFYAITLISLSLLDVVVRAFAAQKDTLTPLIVSFFTTALNIGLAIWLSRPIEMGGLSHGGPPLANGVAVGIEATTGLVILHIRWRGVDARRILIDTGKAILAATGMALAVQLLTSTANAGPLVNLILGGGLGLLVYLVLALLLGLEEVRTVPIALIAPILSRLRSPDTAQ